jgi:cardiolipin synthase
LRRLPNFITSLRLIASPVLVWLLIQFRFRAALALVLLAGLTDWLDGFAARRFGASGRLGAILDPLADKTMLVLLFITLGLLGFIPLWLAALVIIRDMVIVAGAALLRFFRDIRIFKPSGLGKVSTFFQIVFVLLVLLHTAFPGQLIRLLKDAALICTTAFTFLSGLGYVRLGIRLARAASAVRI